MHREQPITEPEPIINTVSIITNASFFTANTATPNLLHQRQLAVWPPKIELGTRSVSLMAQTLAPACC